MDQKEKKGKKNDQNIQEKPALAYIPKEAMWELGKALSFGASKYDKFNFKNGIEVTRTVSAALRHIYQFLDGENFDEESKAHHLGAAMANLSMAIDTCYNKPEMDDRHKK